jgi:polar amino acid transport system permease protein
VPPWLQGALAFLLVAGVFAFSFHQLTYHWNWAEVYKYRAKFVQGWLVTVFISMAALGLSTLIGTAFAAGATQPHWRPSGGRGDLCRIHPRHSLARADLDLLLCRCGRVSCQQPLFRRRLTLSFFSGAYISEIIRAGIESVGKSATRFGTRSRLHARANLSLRLSSRRHCGKRFRRWLDSSHR